MHQRVRSLLIASAIWLLLIAAGAYITLPTIGPVAVSIEPNPFWSVIATGDPAAAFQVSLKAVPWLIWCLAPIVILWLLALVMARRQNTSAT